MLLPLKQGLKLGVFLSRPPNFQVVMLLPLKQGLKPGVFLSRPLNFRVVMLLPLKQGLKQASEAWGEEKSDGCYATSIKTRIETSTAVKGLQFDDALLCYFH